MRRCTGGRRPTQAFGVRAGDYPDRQVRLLVDARPDVDVAVVPEAALPAERLVLGQALSDEVVRIVHALALQRRVGVGRVDLGADAAHEAGDDAAARNAIQHGNLFRHAHRVVAMHDRGADDRDLRLRSLAREDRGVERHDRVEAGHRLVVLVEHDVEPEVIGVHVLVQVAVVEVGGDGGVAVLTWDDDAGGAVLLLDLRRDEGVGHLGEVVGAHEAS